MFLRKIKKIIANCCNFLAQIMMQSHCVICNKIIDNGYFCPEDFSNLSFITDPKCEICCQPFDFKTQEIFLCAKCSKKKPLYDKAISIMRYDDVSKKIILGLKYFDQTYLSKIIAKMMLNGAKDVALMSDLIVSVPLHKSKLGKRKFNQSILIAKNIAKIAKIPICYDILIRTKATKSQFVLKKDQRYKNLKDALIFNDKYLAKIKGLNILLIDDVITTGATIHQCCRVLRKAGVNKIYVLTLAKTVII